MHDLQVVETSEISSGQILILKAQKVGLHTPTGLCIQN